MADLEDDLAAQTIADLETALQLTGGTLTLSYTHGQFVAHAAIVRAGWPRRQAFKSSSLLEAVREAAAWALHPDKGEQS